MDYLLQYTDLPPSHILIALFLVVIGAAGRNKKSLAMGGAVQVAVFDAFVNRAE